MFNYMTDISLVDDDPTCDIHVEVIGHDKETLLFNFLQQCLEIFLINKFAFKTVKMVRFNTEQAPFSISAIG